jgi:hypothetical protein
MKISMNGDRNTGEISLRTWDYDAEGWVNVRNITGDINGYVVIDLTMNADSGQYELDYQDVDGEDHSLTPGSLAPDIVDFYTSAVIVDYLGGVNYLKYVKIYGAGDSSELPSADLPGQLYCYDNEAVLDSCGVNEPTYQSSKRAGNATASYAAVDTFCKSYDPGNAQCSGVRTTGIQKLLGDVCNLDELNNIMYLKPACANQIMKYCVDKTYPYYFGGSTNANGAASIQGTTVCMTNLGISVTFDNVVSPVTSSIYRLFLANAVEIGLIFIFIAFIVAIGLGRGKK